MIEVKERITTVEDGPQTVNERLSTGGPGPEGQADTVTERLSGDTPAEVSEPEQDETAKPRKTTAKKA